MAIKIHKITKFQTQITIFVLLLILRFAANNVLSHFGYDNLSAEFLRLGTDLATISVVLLVVSAYSTDIRLLDFYGINFMLWLIIVSILYILTYSLFRFVAGTNIEDLSLNGKFLYFSSLIAGMIGLSISSMIIVHGEEKQRAGGTL